MPASPISQKGRLWMGSQPVQGFIFGDSSEWQVQCKRLLTRILESKRGFLEKRTSKPCNASHGCWACRRMLRCTKFLHHVAVKAVGSFLRRAHRAPLQSLALKRDGFFHSCSQHWQAPVHSQGRAPCWMTTRRLGLAWLPGCQERALMCAPHHVAGGGSSRDKRTCDGQEHD